MDEPVSLALAAQIETSPPRWRVVYGVMSERHRSEVMHQPRADGLIRTEPERWEPPKP